MQEKIIKLRYKGSPIEIKTEAAVKPEDLYGNQRKSVELNGIVLEKTLVTPWGELFKPNAFGLGRLDEEGCLAEPPIPCLLEDRSELPILPSSYKTTRLLEDASPEDLLNLKTRTVIPIETTLPKGLYKTQYNYRDNSVLEPAILNITGETNFLLVGEATNPPFLKKEETYTFFEKDEETNTEEETSFSVF